MGNVRRFGVIAVLVWTVAMFSLSALAVAQTQTPESSSASAMPQWAHLDAHVAQALPMQASRAGQAPFINTANVHLPEGLLPILLDALAAFPNGATHFLLASTRESDTGDWGAISYAPLDGPDATEVYIGEGGSARLMLAVREATGWQVAPQDSVAFDKLLARAPNAFISAEAKAMLNNARRTSASNTTVDYKWPWPASLSWRWMQGWHYKSAHDIGTNGSDKRALASADGVITYVCRGNVGAAVRIKHADGQETGYWHIDAGQLAPGIAVLQTVKQGQVLGILRPGTWSDTQGCQQYTSQTADNAHIHWEIPGNFTVEGWTITTNASAFIKDAVTKTCNGGCWQANNFFTSSNQPGGNPDPTITPTPSPTLTPTPTATPTALPASLSFEPAVVYTQPNVPITLSVVLTGGRDITDLSFSLLYSGNLALSRLAPTGTVPHGVIAVAQFTPTQYGVAQVQFSQAVITQSNDLTQTPLTQPAWVYVGGCAGDLDLDAAVTLTDVRQLALRWPSAVSETLYLAGQDFDDNDHIDIADVQRVAYRVGSTCTEPLSEPITASAVISSNAPIITLTLQPIIQSIFAGGSVTVGIVLSEVAPFSDTLDLGGFSLAASYSQTALQLREVASGPLLVQSGREFTPLPMTATVSTDILTHTIGIVSLGVSPTLTLTNELSQSVLAILTIQTSRSGTQTLQLGDVLLVNQSGNIIPAALNESLEIYVSDGHPVYLPVLIR